MTIYGWVLLVLVIWNILQAWRMKQMTTCINTNGKAICATAEVLRKIIEPDPDAALPDEALIRSIYGKMMEDK